MHKLSMEELHRPSKEEYEKTDKLPVIFVLDNIRSLSNVGSIFRTADAFRIGELFLCGITACPPHREIHKTALGADETVKWRYFKTTEEACETLKKMNYELFAVEQVEDSIKLQDFVAKENSAYVMGNEVEGVGEEVVKRCDHALELPQEGTKHSLNVSVCAGIVAWDIFRQLSIEKAYS